jgi:hypothetical protein
LETNVKEESWRRMLRKRVGHGSRRERVELFLFFKSCARGFFAHEKFVVPTTRYLFLVRIEAGVGVSDNLPAGCDRTIF